MRQVRKGRKSGREAISRVEKTLQNDMQIAPICQALPKLQGVEHWHMQLEIRESLQLFIYGY